jgi:hypothetical protein
VLLLLELYKFNFSLSVFSALYSTEKFVVAVLIYSQVLSCCGDVVQSQISSS